MRERLTTTLTWPVELARGPTEREAEQKVLNRLYELKNLLGDTRGTLDCLLNEPVGPRDPGKIAALKIEEARLTAAIIQQQARVRDLEQAI